MVATSTLEEQPLDETFDSIYQVLRRERTRTETECEVFEEFADRITDLQPSGASSSITPTGETLKTADGSGTLESRAFSTPSATNHLAVIRDAYEETVMSVPFYEAEYGDTYEESLSEEFGHDIATALTQGSGFSPTLKRVLLAKVEEAHTEREVLIETCDHEHESIEEAAAELKPIDEELESFKSIPLNEQGFGALEAHRARLLMLKDKCEQAATTRQTTIQHDRQEYNLPIEAPDICAYLYKPLETTYPVLVLCSELAQRIETYRRRVEHAMSARP
jgi:hypothetical protein